MSDETFNTIVLQNCLDRMRAGETEAENDLVKVVQVRLRALVNRKFRGFPNLRGVADSDDVFQNSVMRLLTALRRIRPATTRDFMGLAAVRIRCTLLDLARSVKGKRTVSLSPPGSTDSPTRDEPAAPEAVDMDEWVELHEAVDRLPAEEREVVGLYFYHGWKQEEIAALLKISARTVRRRWDSACRKIRKLANLDCQRPGGEDG
jgi:RNA polymerase sigma-70 factor (ECF subfamily)